jgi:hypothetical protein
MQGMYSKSLKQQRTVYLRCLIKQSGDWLHNIGHCPVDDLTTQHWPLPSRWFDYRTLATAQSMIWLQNIGHCLVDDLTTEYWPMPSRWFDYRILATAQSVETPTVGRQQIIDLRTHRHSACHPTVISGTKGTLHSMAKYIASLCYSKWYSCHWDLNG